MSQNRDGEPSFDIRHIPFSMRGSWFNLSSVTGLHSHSDRIHLVTHKNGMHPILAFALQLDGAPVRVHHHATPSTFSWITDPGELRVEATYDGPGTLRIRGAGVALHAADAAGELTPFAGSYLYVEPRDGSIVITSYESGQRYRITTLSGTTDVGGAEALGAARRWLTFGADGQPWEIVLQETTTAAAPFQGAESFDEAADATAASFAAYLESVAPWRSDAAPGAALAAYVIWSATVEPAGFMTRESVLMSKHWMDKLWSWDHCFNALALAPGLPAAAIDQFLAPFDHQDATGALPDSITHSEVLYNYVKPPIHGWALRKLRRAAGHDALTADTLQEIYRRLAAWTSFWLEERRIPANPVPYYQHGNDSGWDNSTTFDLDRVVHSPDLAAFIVVQLDTLADLADELGMPSDYWRSEGASILAALISDLWSEDAFVARSVHDGRASSSTSLLNLLPLVAGERLPPAMRHSMAARAAQHLTDHGLATEPVVSPHYEDDGYWRGPIWAPATALIEDGLRQCGYADLADDVSARFRKTCERSGFAENFDARTGEGLRDRAYTWTAAVYLMLAREALGPAAEGAR